MAAVNRLAQRCRTIIRQAGQAGRAGSCAGVLSSHPPTAPTLSPARHPTAPLPRSVIHQPSSEVFALFDKLCLLSDGHVVYFGAASRAADFFEQAGLGVPANRNPGAPGCSSVAGGAAVRPVALAALPSWAETPSNSCLPVHVHPTLLSVYLFVADHFLHVINRDFMDSQDVETNIQKLVTQYKESNSEWVGGRAGRAVYT